MVVNVLLLVQHMIDLFRIVFVWNPVIPEVVAQ